MPINTPALIDFAQRLVRTPSPTGAEGAAARLAAAEMTALGFDRVWIDELGSAIGLIEGRRPGPTLLLDGHLDTVGAHPPDWRGDPWSGQIEGGRLYGRGAADMKASLAAMIHAAAGLERGALAGRVAVSATVAEEVFEGGALRPVIAALQPAGVIIGEATRLNLNHGGRGRAEIVVTTIGRPAHSSSPAAGRCAVTDMLRLIQAVAARPAPQDALLGPGSIVLTDILSEPYPGRSVIPYRCRVTYDRRLLPGETPGSVLAALAGLPGLGDITYQTGLAAVDERSYTGAALAGEKFFPAWRFPAEHPFVQAALQGLRLAGLAPGLGAYRFCTNAAYSAGIAGLPTVGFGLGAEEDAHVVDEAIALADLEAAARGYQGMLGALCGG